MDNTLSMPTNNWGRLLPYLISFRFPVNIPFVSNIIRGYRIKKINLYLNALYFIVEGGIKLYSEIEDKGEAASLLIDVRKSKEEFLRLFSAFDERNFLDSDYTKGRLIKIKKAYNTIENTLVKKALRNAPNATPHLRELAAAISQEALTNRYIKNA